MLRLSMALLMGGASGACGFAALGLALYADGPSQSPAAALFAGVGFIAGLACGGLHRVFDGVPDAPAAALPPEAVAGLVRATLSHLNAQRQPRAGSAADRRPTAAEAARSALAGAAAASAASAASNPGKFVTPAVVSPLTADPRRLAGSRHGA